MQPAAQEDIRSRNAALLSQARQGDDGAVSELFRLNSGLICNIAARFLGRGAEFDDLCQIGSIGMLKAIRSFECERGTAFSTYAVPMIIGEIRRFLRDDGLIKIGRTVKHNGAALMAAREKYIAAHGSEPHLHELAAMCGIDPVDAAASIDALIPAASLSSTVGDSDLTLEQTLCSEDDEYEGTVDRLAIKQAVGKLPQLQRQIVILRYYLDYTQQRTAEALGLTQVKISREEKKICEALRSELS